MYGEIVFYTHGSTIEYGGEIFAAGELTADILNFAPEDYRPIQRLLNRMKELARQYEDTLERGVWWELNNHLIELRSQLMRYRVFQILLKEDDRFLNETQQYTESYSLFTDEEMDEKDCTLERCLDLYQKEEEEQIVSVRSRFKGDEGSQNLDDFIAAITEEIRTKEIRKEEVQEEKTVNRQKAGGNSIDLVDYLPLFMYTEKQKTESV